MVLLVHLRHKQLRMREVELFALGLANESNGQQLNSLIQSYRRLMFPGSEEFESDVDKKMEQAKKLLAEEAKKVLLVRPLRPGESLGSSELSANMKKLAARAAADMEKDNAKELRRRRRRAKEAGRRKKR